MANLRQRLSKLPPRPEVKVKVLNGSGVTGIAGQTATALTGRGFDVVGTGPATGASGADDYSYRNSVIEYASAAELPYVNTLRNSSPRSPSSTTPVSTWAPSS